MEFCSADNCSKNVIWNGKYEKFSGINFNILVVSIFNTVITCGGCPTHQHHYVKSVFAATTLDNTVTYIYILKHNIKIH